MCIMNSAMPHFQLVGADSFHYLRSQAGSPHVSTQPPTFLAPGSLPSAGLAVSRHLCVCVACCTARAVAVRAALAVHAVACSAVQCRRSANALRAVSYKCIHRALRAVRRCRVSGRSAMAWRGVAWRGVLDVVPSARVVLLTLQMPNEPLIIEAFPMAQTAER